MEYGCLSEMKEKSSEIALTKARWEGGSQKDVKTFPVS